MVVVWLSIGAQFFVHFAWLDTMIVLVFTAAIFLDVANYLVIKDLANLDTGVDPNRLNSEHFKRPVASKANIAKSSSYVDKKSKSSDRGSSFDHWNQVVCCRVFDGTSEVKPIGFEDESRFGNRQMTDPICLSHVQHNFFVGNDFVVKSKVVAIGIEIVWVKRVDFDIVPDTPFDFITGQDHDVILYVKGER